MNILVTGAAGFIASHVAQAFLDVGHEVFVIDDLSSGNQEVLDKRIGFYKINICDPNISRLFEAERFDVLCHHAAQIDVRASVNNPTLDLDVNVKGLINLMEAGRRNGLQKVIFASTGGAIYGEPEYIPQNESHPEHPLSPYGINKLAGELYLNFYLRTYGIPYVALRYANVYGPRQNPHGEAGVVAIFTEQLLTGIQPQIYGDGKQTRDFIYIGDVVQANLRALAYAGSGSFNIGTGNETSINQVFDTLAELTNYSKPAILKSGKHGEQRRSVLDSQLAHRELGWLPQISLKTGLAKTVAWFENNLTTQIQF